MGKSVTAEFRVNQETAGNQEYPSTCALSSYKFAVAWQSDGQDGSDYGVYATVFRSPSSSPPIGDDDDDDDDEGLDMGIVIVIIILASVGAGVVVIAVLIKKGIIDISKLKRE
jgi:hypothetical protein